MNGPEGPVPPMTNAFMALAPHPQGRHYQLYTNVEATE
jgi:hypothetical protein